MPKLIEMVTNIGSVAELCQQKSGRRVNVRLVSDWMRMKPKRTACQCRYVVSRVRDITTGSAKHLRRALLGTRCVFFREQYPLQGLPTVFSAVGEPNRVHLVPIEQQPEFLDRFASTLGYSDRILDAWWEDDTLVVLSPSYQRLHVPRSALVALNEATDEQLHNFEIDTEGAYVYWPDLDVHLGWEQFTQAVDPHAALRARQQSAEFNKRYGAAIRKFREESGIRQSDIAGLTARQVGRIERGECRATHSALTKLASAHQMTTAAYMGKLASIL